MLLKKKTFWSKDLIEEMVTLDVIFFLYWPIMWYKDKATRDTSQEIWFGQTTNTRFGASHYACLHCVNVGLLILKMMRMNILFLFFF